MGSDHAFVMFNLKLQMYFMYVTFDTISQLYINIS